MMHALDGAGLQNYLACGVSFHASPVEIREKVAVPPQRLSEALDFVIGQPGVRECVILSTCNRTELYLSAEEWVDGRVLFVRFARALRSFDLSLSADQVYSYRGLRAVLHLFRVASSLDSLVIGEPQILGQTKSAFRESEARGCVGRDLHRLVPRAFAAAKTVRNETGICDSAVSVSYAAVQLARKIFETLSGKSVALVGAGKTSELAAMHLKEAGARSIAVTNRTLTRAEELAEKCSGIAVEFEKRWEQIAGADVVICSTDAPHFILWKEGVARIMRSRPKRPLLVLDISVPRNVDPKVAGIEGVYLFNIDDLDAVVRANQKGRQAEAVRAEGILQRALERFVQEENYSQMGPAIAAIRNQIRTICLSELERLEQNMPGITPEERRELELMLHRIAQKIVHPAIMELKTSGSEGSELPRLTLVEKLFGIGREASFLNS